MKTGLIPLFLVLLLVPALSAPAATIRVPADQPTIQDGIDAAVDGDTVVVADGTWTGQGNRDIWLVEKAITLRSENGPAACIIDCELQEKAFNVHNCDSPGTVIEGFTIARGHDQYDHGGGVKANSSSLIIRGNTFTGCRKAGIMCFGGSPQILGNRIIGTSLGGGIRCSEGSPMILGNLITENEGGGILCEMGCTAYIADNLIIGNSGTRGGGILCESFGEGAPSCTVINNIISGNTASLSGGGIACRSASVTISHNTIVGNQAALLGGGILVTRDSHPTITDTILWDNSAPNGDEIHIGETGNPSDLVISFSDVQGGETAVTAENGCNYDWSWGMIDEDPVFVTGFLGDHYLSQTNAGQPVPSPCVDTGSTQAADITVTTADGEMGMDQLTTSTAQAGDTSRLDMGFHYASRTVSGPYLAISPGPAPDNPSRVGFFRPQQGAGPYFEFTAYNADRYGAKVTSGDLDGDGVDEILTGAGPGEIFGPHVRGFDVNGMPLPGLSFLAYGTNKYGVNVASGDLDGDGRDEIVTGAGPGAVFGPHVRGWLYPGPTTVFPLPGVNYFAYGTPKWGVNVACGDIDGDGFDEIVTGAGPGAVYGPHVRGWNVDGGEATAIPGVSYLAYGTNKYGVNVSCGDVDGDGIDEIVTGAGPGAVFGPHVRGWNYDDSAITPLPGFSFFAWETAPLRFGVNVFAGTDLNNDGRNDLVTGRGPDPGADTEVKVFTYDGVTVSQWLSVEAFPGNTHGVNVAAGRF